ATDENHQGGQPARHPVLGQPVHRGAQQRGEQQRHRHRDHHYPQSDHDVAQHHDHAGDRQQPPGQRSRHPQRVRHRSRRITAGRAGGRTGIHAATLSVRPQWDVALVHGAPVPRRTFALVTTQKGAARYLARGRREAHRMGSPSGSRRRNLIMILAGLIIFNVMSCTRPAGTLATFQSARSDELCISGQWNIIDVPPRSRVNAIHAALLPTGKVLIIAGSGNSPENFDAGSFTTLLWDPQTGQFSLIPTPDDMFCAGHTLLPDGKLLVAGGTQRYQKGTQPAHGASYSYEFDPQTQRYERVADMHHGRWYPTLVGLADGNALAVSGLDESGQPLDGHHELFRRDISQWIELPALNRYFPTYPALFLTADGRLFYSASTAGYGHSDGAGRRPGLWNLADNSFTPVDGLRDPNLTETSTSVLLPPAQDQRVMVLGGGGIDDSAESTAR